MLNTCFDNMLYNHYSHLEASQNHTEIYYTLHFESEKIQAQTFHFATRYCKNMKTESDTAMQLEWSMSTLFTKSYSITDKYWNTALPQKFTKHENNRQINDNIAGIHLSQTICISSTNASMLLDTPYFLQTTEILLARFENQPAFSLRPNATKYDGSRTNKTISMKYWTSKYEGWQFDIYDS